MGIGNAISQAATRRALYNEMAALVWLLRTMERADKADLSRRMWLHCSEPANYGPSLVDRALK